MPTKEQRKIWSKTYREKHKEQIKEYRRTNSARLEANRDPEKRKASRRAYYERSKAYWIQRQREKRAEEKSISLDTTSRIDAIVAIANGSTDDLLAMLSGTTKDSTRRLIIQELYRRGYDYKNYIRNS